MRVLSGALVVLGAALVAGCGTGGPGDPNADKGLGKQLFTQKCAGCHTLADAGAKGNVGPNLDQAFAAVRSKRYQGQGFDVSTIREVVLGQIRIPNPPMPANLVRGEEASAVANYVASVAGLPVQGGGGKITATSGKAIFTAAGCSGCHTLKDAGSTGTVGPNLDNAKPPKSLVVDRVTNGKGAMPSFKDRLTKQQIEAAAEYVSSVAGK